MFVEHKEAVEITEAPPKITKFSQAIREGAKLREQSRGGPFVGDKSCAIGAAYEALGGPITEEILEDTSCAWDFVCHRLGYSFGHIGSWEGDSLMQTIFEKNDTEKLTREQIADWLEGQGL